ncbi:Spondin-1 [Trichinella nelsoni]|uniref:Spondin-1 n=1 Tax=Trichinella nelsoni TaxID=6336 RepID=A0A0V0S6K7_9BILA|nr:Spondin-1 [Trichinella nelsoni]
MFNLCLTIVVVISITTTAQTKRVDCNRKPIKNDDAIKSPGNNGFHITIQSYPLNQSSQPVNSYVPGEKYTVLEKLDYQCWECDDVKCLMLLQVKQVSMLSLLSIEGWKTRYTEQTFRGFTLVAVSANDNSQPLGFFHASTASRLNGSIYILVKEDRDVSWSADCWHAVTHSSLFPKTNASVVWQAPPSDEGCVHFKAAVLEYPNIWYMDDDDLTKPFCASAGFTAPGGENSINECCACDEAKYEVTFEGLWSKNTHPKDYPSCKFIYQCCCQQLQKFTFTVTIISAPVEHLTHFSDIIGASHSPRYTMWTYDGYASDGLKELAEWGNTQKYEQEIREQTSEVRTILKARGLWFPDVQGTTRAMFHVDKYHHLVSLASMLGPSPDWVVGVSMMDLCLKNCSWINEKSLFLYPWDAGVDGGITYMSPNSPSIPREPIKPITTSDPNDPRSPFYNANSDVMPPFAKLTFRKEKVYPSECKDPSEYVLAWRSAGAETETSEDIENKNTKECTVNSWTPWSLCSATCGKGIRMRTRVYKNPIKAHLMGCSRQMNEKQFCNAIISVCDDSENFNDLCAATTWAQWTPCSVNCGHGVRSRVRNYLNPMAIKQCHIRLTENENCTGPAGPNCDLKPDPRCQTTYWSEWSPCSHSCDQGNRIRTRLLYYPENQKFCEHHQLLERENCNVQSCEAFLRMHGAGETTFHSLFVVFSYANREWIGCFLEICNEPVEPGQCEGTFPRYYFNPAKKACMRFTFTGCKGNRNNFQSEEQCKNACADASDINYNYTGKLTEIPISLLISLESAAHLEANNNIVSLLPEMSKVDTGQPVDCVVSVWSDWSECSQTCGRGRRERVRTVVTPARNGGQPCPVDLVEKARCRLRPCAIVCRIGHWSEWSACSANCGTGVQMRQRSAKSSDRRSECPPHQTEKRICVVNNC